MEVKLDADGILSINMNEVIEHLVSMTPDNKMDDLIEMFAFQPRMFKFVACQLADEFVRNHYNEYIHIGREEFLNIVKDEEIKYYASKIADKLANAWRYEQAWLQLHTWCRDQGVFKMPDFPKSLTDWPRTDVSFERHLEELIAEAFKENRYKKQEEPTA